MVVVATSTARSPEPMSFASTPALAARVSAVSSAMVRLSATPATVSTESVKVFVALSTPPFAMPPVSCTITVTVATPPTPLTGVKVSVPFAAMAGAAMNNPALSVVTV